MEEVKAKHNQPKPLAQQATVKAQPLQKQASRQATGRVSNRFNKEKERERERKKATRQLSPNANTNYRTHTANYIVLAKMAAV